MAAGAEKILRAVPKMPEPRPCHVRGWWYETAETSPDPMPTFGEMHRAFAAQDGKGVAAEYVACAMAAKSGPRSRRKGGNNM